MEIPGCEGKATTREIIARAIEMSRYQINKRCVIVGLDRGFESMDYRKLGNSDLVISVVGLGCNNFVHRCDLEHTRALVHKAIDLGVTLFDTADVYGSRGGSESFLGQILGDRRKDVVLATKFGQPMDDAGELKGTSRRYVMTAVEASLKRLRTDWIDLYQLHWPNAVTPIEGNVARPR